MGSKRVVSELVVLEGIATRKEIADFAAQFLTALSDITASVNALRAEIQQLNEGQATMNATVQQISDDLDTIKTQTIAYIKERDDADAARDAVDVDLRKQIADLTAASGQIPQAVQDQIDAAFAKAEDAKSAIPQPAPPPAVVPPGDGSNPTT